MAVKIRTVVTYNLDGATTTFTIPFEYLARKFVVVTLIGTDRKELVLNQDYRFSSKTQITTSVAWGTGSGYTLIEIRRFTSATERLVDFADGSILRAYDLNISQVQTLHVAEEARDLTADTIGVNNDGQLDARGRRIVNVADPVDDTDAVNLGTIKGWDTGAYQSYMKAKEQADLAAASAASSKASESSAKKFSENSKASEDAAKDYSDVASRESLSARASADDARASAEAAARSALEAEGAKEYTLEQAGIAKHEADRAKGYAESISTTIDVGGFRSVDEIRKYTGVKRGSGYVNLVSHHLDHGRGGGLFIVDDIDTSTPDDGGNVFVSANGLRFKRVNPSFHIDNFGGLPGGVENDDALDRIIQAYPDNKLHKPCIYLGEGIYHFNKLGHTFGGRKALFMSIRGTGVSSSGIQINATASDSGAFINAPDESAEFSDFSVTCLVDGSVVYSNIVFVKSKPTDNMADNDFVFTNIAAKGLRAVHHCYGRGSTHHSCTVAHCSYFSIIESPEPFVEGDNSDVMSVRTSMRRYVSDSLMVDGCTAVFRFEDTGAAGKYMNEVTIHGLNGIYLSTIIDGGYIQYASIKTGALVSSLGLGALVVRRLLNSTIDITASRGFDVNSQGGSMLTIPKVLDIVTPNLEPTSEVLLDNVSITGVIGSLNGSLIRCYGRIGNVSVSSLLLPRSYEKLTTNNITFIDVRGGYADGSTLTASNIAFSGKVFPYGKFYWFSPAQLNVGYFKINHKTISYGHVVTTPQSGTGVIAAGTTARNIPHGLGFEPSMDSIVVTQTDPSAHIKCVTFVSATSFTVTQSGPASGGGDGFRWYIDF